MTPSSPRSADSPGLDPFHRRASVAGMVLACAAIVETALLTVFGWWPGVALPAPGFPLFAGAFATYLVGAWAADRGRGSLAPIFVAALLMRVALMPLAPELSDDVYRYLWDGHVQLSGVNPYLYAPGDAALDSLTTDYRGLINNPMVPTIYPPFAQVAFLLIAAAGGTILQAKILWTIFDLATGAALAVVAGRTGRNPRVVTLLYLWSPLLVVETAWSGHLEPFGLFALVLVLALARRPGWAGVAMAWTTLIKFAPAAAVPALARRLGWRFVAVFSLVCAVLYLPYASAGRLLFQGLGTYAEHWRFNESVFALLEIVFRGPLAPRYVAAGLLLLLVVWAAWRRWDAERALFWTLGAGFILSPTLHPWYALWILPLAALRQSRAWILFTGTVFIGYWGLPTFLESGDWPRPVWGRFLLWLPVAGLLALDTVKSRLAGEHPTGGEADAHPEASW